MIRRVLIPLGGTPYTQVAIRHGLEIATAQGADVTGVTVLDVRSLYDVGPVPIGASQAARRIVDARLRVSQNSIEEVGKALLEQATSSGVRATVLQESGNPCDLLVSHWRHHDLTVAGLRGFCDYGAVPEPDDALARIVRHAVGPILATAAEYRPIYRVLVAYDGSTGAARALAAFIRTNLWPRAQVTVAMFENAEDSDPRALENAADYLRVHGYVVEAARVKLDVREELLPFASDHSSDLIVLGDSSRGFMARRLLGDTVMKLLRSADRPLFLSH